MTNNIIEAAGFKAYTSSQDRYDGIAKVQKQNLTWEDVATLMREKYHFYPHAVTALIAELKVQFVSPVQFMYLSDYEIDSEAHVLPQYRDEFAYIESVLLLEYFSTNKKLLQKLWRWAVVVMHAKESNSSRVTSGNLMANSSATRHKWF